MVMTVVVLVVVVVEVVVTMVVVMVVVVVVVEWWRSKSASVGSPLIAILYRGGISSRARTCSPASSDYLKAETRPART